jgi:ADP-L-glycero-D-manno-heptose 6-epimerase
VIAHHGHGAISYIPFPEELLGAYQHRTCADMSAARSVGFSAVARDIALGVRAYLDSLRP